MISGGGKINKAGKPITSLAKYSAVRQTIHITACMEVCGQTKKFVFFIVFFYRKILVEIKLATIFSTIKTNQ